MATTNSNVGFKRGTQAALNTLKTQVASGSKSFAEGSFYLTTDSDRLYFAQSATELVDLNQYVRTVEQVSSLPTTASDPSLQPGDFYYALKENVFCIRNNTNTGWTQINPDTYLVPSTTAVGVSSVTGGAKVTTSVKDSKDNIATGDFQIVGGTDVTITTDATNRKITINSQAKDTHYTLGTESSSNNTGKIKLSSTGSDSATTVTIKSNNNDLLTVASDASGNVTLKPADQRVKTVTNSFDATGGLTTSVTVGGEAVSSAAITPTISYGNTKTNATFNSGTATLNVYTINEVDSKIQSEINKKLQAADAMHFAGTLGNTGTTKALPDITTVSNGTTYKIVDTPITGLNKVKVGDLVVAFGTEDSLTGVITSGSWIIVPSGDDQAITGQATASTVLIQDSLANEDIAGISVASKSGNPVKVTGQVNNKTTTFTVEHNELTTKVGTKAGSTSNVTQTTNTDAEYTAITSITVDNFGHVTDAKTSKFTVKDTHNSITGVNVTAANKTDAINTVNINTVVTSTDDGDKSGTLTMKSTSLQINGSTATSSGSSVGNVTINLVWESF